jgi:hypothetical protein
MTIERERGGQGPAVPGLPRHARTARLAAHAAREAPDERWRRNLRPCRILVDVHERLSRIGDLLVAATLRVPAPAEGHALVATRYDEEKAVPFAAVAKEQGWTSH